MTRLGPSIHQRPAAARVLAPRVLPRPDTSRSTTNQGRVLDTAIIGAAGTERGVMCGVEQSAQTAYFGGPFEAYQDRRTSSPNVLIVGPVGAGKSTCAKTVYITRPGMLKRRRGVVMDIKGEYVQLTREMRGTVHRMAPGASDCTTLNPLDPVVLAGAGRSSAGTLLTAFAQLGDPAPMSSMEHDVLTIAHRVLIAKFAGGRVPVLPDLVGLMPSVVDADEYKGYRESTRDAVDLASLNVATRLRRALADDVAGLFDGETSRDVQVDPKLTTYDLADLPKDGPAMGMAMAAAFAMLLGKLRYSPDKYLTTLLMEEAWSFPALARQIKSNTKLSRMLGLSNVGILQHLSDVPVDSDGYSLIKEAGTVHVFRQESEEDQQDCIRAFGLNPENEDLLGELAQGEHLMKVGTEREVHLRGELTETEYRLIETDGAMKR